jgi:hypothetical protein
VKNDAEKINSYRSAPLTNDFLERTSPGGSFRHRGTPKTLYPDANAQIPEWLKTGGSSLDSLAKMTSNLSLQHSNPKQSTESDTQQREGDCSSSVPGAASEKEIGSSQGSSVSPSSSSVLSPILDWDRQNAVNSLMVEFETLLDSSLYNRARARQPGGRSGSGGSQNVSERNGGLSGSIRPGGLGIQREKRPRNGNGRENSEPSDSEGERDGEPKRTKLNSESELEIGRRFACPYNRRNPHRHSKNRSCVGPGWSTVHRVKYLQPLRD